MFSNISPVKKYAIVLIFLVAAVLGTLKVFHHVSLGGNDERTYAFYMNTVNNYGIGTVSSLSQAYYKVPDNQRPPTPLRVFFIFTGVLTCQISGTCGLQNLAMISFFSRIILILIAFFWLSKLFDPKIAFLSSVLLLISPAGLWSAERALQDSFFALLMVAAIIAYHYCWNGERPRMPLLFGMILVAGFLTKESMIFLYPCFFTSGIYYWRQNKTIPWRRILMPLISSPIIYLIIISILVGGLGAVIDHYVFFMKGMNKVEYVARFQLGPWYRPIIDWMLVSPVAFLLAVVGMVISVSSQKNTGGRNLMAIYLISGLLVFGTFSIQNLRYVLFLDVFICALAVIGALSLSEKMKNHRYQTAIFALILLLIASSDIIQFFKIFVVAKVYDPVTATIMTSLGFIR